MLAVVATVPDTVALAALLTLARLALATVVVVTVIAEVLALATALASVAIAAVPSTVVLDTVLVLATVLQSFASLNFVPLIMLAMVSFQFGDVSIAIGGVDEWYSSPLGLI